MAEADIQATMDELYAAYVQGDFDRLSSLMDESIEWMIYAPVTVFPFAGPRRGRAAAVQTMREIAQAYAIESYQREIVTVKEERVAVVADVRMRQRATQRMLRFRVANFMRFEDGRLVEFREFINSFDLAEQALGRELAL
jgi:ketosteroid isomerase-like protein